MPTADPIEQRALVALKDALEIEQLEQRLLESRLAHADAAETYLYVIEPDERSRLKKPIIGPTLDFKRQFVRLLNRTGKADLTIADEAPIVQDLFDLETTVPSVSSALRLGRCLSQVSHTPPGGRGRGSRHPLGGRADGPPVPWELTPPVRGVYARTFAPLKRPGDAQYPSQGGANPSSFQPEPCGQASVCAVTEKNPGIYDLKEIPLTQGFVAIVDDEDYQWVNEHKWHVSVTRGLIYAKRAVSRGGQNRTIYMHREILGRAVDGLQSDHANQNGLDNRRANLRVATQQQNLQNRGPFKKNRLGLKGVRWNVRRQKWIAQITVNGRTKLLGAFLTLEEAYQAYCGAARPVHGQFARL